MQSMPDNHETQREREARRLVAEAGRMLLAKRLAARTWGNVSCRIGEERMLITPSGMDYEAIAEEDIVCYDMANGVWEGLREPSSEKLVHIAAYRAFPEAQFVIHTHQTYASALALTGPASLTLTGREQAALGGLAFNAYALPGTEELSANAQDSFRAGAQTVLMVRHGAVIVGKSREEAFERALLLEELCRRACKGLPEHPPAENEALARRLIACATRAFGFAIAQSSPAALACAARRKALPALLDDAAQMIGRNIPAARADEKSVLRALRRRAVVLVPGVGALCRAENAGDVEALRMLAHKACVSALHTGALGVRAKLPLADIIVMRKIFRTKYSKKIGG